MQDLPQARPVLVVDLDGALIRSDMLYEGSVRATSVEAHAFTA